ncbi:Signal transduction histidine-protein kinase/phosphatase DegS [compost metagenome]
MRKQSRQAVQASVRTEVTSIVQARERRQIAQEVHDGVGSHLVSILSSLDQQNPEHRTLALSLEQCLLDLKFTVDSIQPEELTLAEGLGSLRHRIQPSLDRKGLRLRWDMGDEPAMDDMAPLTVRHALRIAQEAISNAIRHSGATELVISCQCTPALDRVELCIRDNGSGMSLARVETQAGGRGLAGMRRRAAEVMGVLDVTSELGSGTRVFLSVPCGRTEVKTHQPIVEG